MLSSRLAFVAIAVCLPLAGPAQATKPLPLVDAEVRKVQSDQGKLTLRHGDIPSLDMPPMIMTYVMADATSLRGLEVGDKVRVGVAKVDGRYTVTFVEKAASK